MAAPQGVECCTTWTEDGAITGEPDLEITMKRFRWVLVLLVATVVATAAPVSATPRHHDLPDRVELPDGWRPEGITTDGRSLYVGSLVDGAIWRASTRTGQGRVLASGVPGRVAVGVEYDARRDLLWVAGGATNQIRAHDADTGRLRATYLFPSDTPRFLNDLVVTRRGVYATDSMNQELAVVPLRRRHGHRLPPASAARTLELTGDLVDQPGFNLNGIVASRGRLLSVQTNTGLLFRIDPWSGRTRTVDLGAASLTSGDGLELDGDTLYAVRNQLNRIAVLDLDRRLTTGELVAELTDPGFAVPTTVALAKRSLWAVNARFDIATPTPDTAYWITRLDAL
jgi:sugar lactone lactonase YvrE